MTMQGVSISGAQGLERKNGVLVPSAPELARGPRSPVGPEAHARIPRADDSRQLHWMANAVAVLLLVPASIAWLTGWRWQPWPAGPNGYGSIFSEARGAANSSVTMAFGGL